MTLKPQHYVIGCYIIHVARAASSIDCPPDLYSLQGDARARLGDSMKDRDQQKNSDKSSGIGQRSRIVNVDKMQEYTDKMNEHATHCDGSIALTSESRDGFFTGESAHPYTEYFK